MGFSQALSEKLSKEKIKVISSEKYYDTMHFRMKKNELLEVAKILKQGSFTKNVFFETAFAIEHEAQLLVRYFFYSLNHNERICLEAVLEKHDLELKSMHGEWSGALYNELEIREMFGISFEGLPENTSFLLPSDWVGYPMRKDYCYPESFHGVEHRRTPIRKEHLRP